MKFLELHYKMTQFLITLNTQPLLREMRWKMLFTCCHMHGTNPTCIFFCLDRAKFNFALGKDHAKRVDLCKGY